MSSPKNVTQTALVQPNVQPPCSRPWCAHSNPLRFTCVHMQHPRALFRRLRRNSLPLNVWLMLKIPKGASPFFEYVASNAREVVESIHSFSALHSQNRPRHLRLVLECQTLLDTSGSWLSYNRRVQVRLNKISIRFGFVQHIVLVLPWILFIFPIVAAIFVQVKLLPF